MSAPDNPRTCSPGRAAGRIAALYLALTLIWIYASDRTLAAFIAVPEQLTAWQTYKGWLFVFGSSTLIFFLIRRALAASQKAEAEVRRLNATLEQRVADRTARLEAANRELEAFSYTVSHDLRAPLRAINGFTRILLEDHAPQLDAEGRRFCSIISDNTRRMGELIDDLLAFSRLGRTELHPASVDMASLANSTFLELTLPPERERIDFHLEQLPPATGDPALLRQVWANLLSNAVKFSAKKQRATIEVRATREGSETVYSVRDNGAGFDMRYGDKLFGVFQRLHHDRDFEGTGVGLAIVQRIVHRHGGRTWAEGAPGEGATFYFTLQQEGK